ncbi:MAG: biotin carboxylase, partial [Leptospiraceae bacterium]|nr:biotin carboxylase [Leptospiraceae bacterium]
MINRPGIGEYHPEVQHLVAGINAGTGEPINVSQDKYRNSGSDWIAGFSCAHLNILIVCRGPIRKEAMDICESLGASYGILLSEKDSVTYPHTLAPELRVIDDPHRIHRVPDYMGTTTEERRAIIQQIVDIAKERNYTHIFAGYGFMAEDAGFVETIERNGIGFVGPASTVHRAAGAKDTAKKIARQEGVSVTPGIDNISALTLYRKAGENLEGLQALAAEHNLHVNRPDSDPLAFAEQILQEAYSKGTGLITIPELQEEATAQVENLFAENPGKRFRLKYIGGGGGKGQRII